MLKYYDPNLPTRVYSDASTTGLGAVLEQKHEDENEWYPVGYASRSMNKSEKNYCQIEQETLSIVFATTKFHNYLYGTQFHVYNDHLPLKSIFMKSITQAPPRIQRFLLRLQKYDFQMHFIPGKDLVVSDALSCASLEDDKPEISEEEMNCHVHSVTDDYPISEKMKQKITAETQSDEQLKNLRRYIEKGWPSERKQIDERVRMYFNHREELTILDNMILKGVCLVIPKSLRSEMKKLLHTGHLGIEKTRQLARSSLYWPGYSHEIAEMISGCEICLENQNKQCKEPIIKHEIPATPWFKVGTDVFHLRGKDYIIVVDYNSNFFDISKMNDAQAPTVVTHTKQIFSRYGSPKEVISDNGPEFKSKEYRSLLVSGILNIIPPALYIRRATSW